VIKGLVYYSCTEYYKYELSKLSIAYADLITLTSHERTDTLTYEYNCTLF
jgi:hypothetical protein